MKKLRIAPDSPQPFPSDFTGQYPEETLDEQGFADSSAISPQSYSETNDSMNYENMPEETSFDSFYGEKQNIQPEDSYNNGGYSDSYSGINDNYSAYHDDYSGISSESFNEEFPDYTSPNFNNSGFDGGGPAVENLYLNNDSSSLPPSAASLSKRKLIALLAAGGAAVLLLGAGSWYWFNGIPFMSTEKTFEAGEAVSIPEGSTIRFLNDENAVVNQNKLTSPGYEYLIPGDYQTVVHHGFITEKWNITVKDTKAPEIASSSGNEKITAEVNSENFAPERYFNARDFSEVKLSVEGSINTSEIGEYPVTVKAEDKFGNTSQFSAVIEIIEENGMNEGKILTEYADGYLSLSAETMEKAKIGDMEIHPEKRTEDMIQTIENSMKNPRPYHISLTLLDDYSSYYNYEVFTGADANGDTMESLGMTYQEFRKYVTENGIEPEKQYSSSSVNAPSHENSDKEEEKKEDNNSENSTDEKDENQSQQNEPSQPENPDENTGNTQDDNSYSNPNINGGNTGINSNPVSSGNTGSSSGNTGSSWTRPGSNNGGGSSGSSSFKPGNSSGNHSGGNSGSTPSNPIGGVSGGSSGGNTGSSSEPTTPPSDTCVIPPGAYATKQEADAVAQAYLMTPEGLEKYWGYWLDRPDSMDCDWWEIVYKPR